MTIKDLLKLVWESKWLILLCTLIFGIGGVLFVESVKPVYKVDALVQLEVAKDSKALNPLGAMADMFNVASPAETEIEVIKSRMVLGRVVEKLHLNVVVTPLGHGPWERLNKIPRPILQVERFDVPEGSQGRGYFVKVLAKNQLVISDEFQQQVGRFNAGEQVDSSLNMAHIGIFVSKVNALEGQVFKVRRLELSEAIGSLRNDLNVAEVGKKTGIIGLALEGFDPVLASKILNEIANAYLTQNVERRSAEAQKTLEFLDGQLPQIKASMEMAENRLNRYRLQVGSIDLTEEAKIALGQQVEVRQALFNAQQKRKEAMQLFKEDHPNVRTQDSIVKAIESQMQTRDHSVYKLPLQQQQIVRLMRDVQVGTELYTTLLNNAQQLRIVKAGEIGNVRIVDYALPKKTPITPIKPLTETIAVLFGLFLGIAIAVVRRFMRSGIEDHRIIDKELGLPTYASIPHSKEQDMLQNKVRRREIGVHLLAITHQDDLTIEAFRSLRTTLNFSMMDAANRILMIAGPSPSIGKSFVSANFAAVLAQTGKNILLIDGDMRRGHLQQYFGLKRNMGLSDVLTERAILERTIVSTGVQGLSLMTTGTVPPNPSELLLHSNFSLMLECLIPMFDYIVIDAPPVLAVTDALIIGKLSGTTLMILKHGQHPFGEIQLCAERFTHAGVVVKGVVMNDVAENSLGDEKYHYGYRYGKQG